jgi:DNA polymerase III delta prime subunit
MNNNFPNCLNEVDLIYYSFILKNINIVKDFKENINYYINNNFYGLKATKEFTFIKNQKAGQSNDELYRFYLYRNKRFNNACKKRGITYENNGGNTYNINNNEEIIANGVDINQNSQEFKFELLASTLIFKLLKESEINEKLNRPEENKQISIKFELPNFNLSDESLMSVISGIKFNNKITEINLCGNLFSKRSS